MSYKYFSFYWTILCLYCFALLFFVFDDEQGVTWFPEIKSDSIYSIVSSPDLDRIRINNLLLIENNIKNRELHVAEVGLPTNSIEIFFQDFFIWYQWRSEKDFFYSIWMDPVFDPANSEPYYYFYNPNTNQYKIVALLDNSQYANAFLGSRPVYSIGSSGENFILNIQADILDYENSGLRKIDISNHLVRGKLNLSEIKSCNDIKNFYKEAVSGVYSILLDGAIVNVYCDMITDGGGWTLFYANNDNPDSPIKISYVSMRDSLKKSFRYDLSDYNNIHLAGLLNYLHFTESGSKEILIWALDVNTNNWKKVFFSSPEALLWSLGDNILGKTSDSCVSLPLGFYWNLMSSDGRILARDLRSIMNAGGISWGVSHKDQPCNGYEWYSYSTFAFYNASSDNDGSRSASFNDTRWSQYRYFLR